MHLRSYLLAAGVVAGTGVPAVAQSTEPSPADSLALPTITVTATRAPVPVEAAPARLGVLDRASIQQTGAASLADLLATRAPGLVRSYGGGGLASLSFRGSGASHTLLLLDGQPLVDPQLGQFDVSLVPTLLLERVEVMNGPGGALYGSDAVGGVVNLQTRPAARKVQAEVRRAAFGAYGAGLLVGERHTRPAGSVGALLALDVSDTDGNYPFYDATAFDPATGTLGRTLRRTNADRQQQTGWLALDAATDAWTGRVGVWLGHTTRGLFVRNQTNQERQDDTHQRIWTSHTVRVALPGSTRDGRLFLNAAWHDAALRYQDPAVGTDDTGHTQVASVAARLETPVGAPFGLWVATVGGEASTGRATHPSLAADADEQRAAAFASAVGSIGRLRLYPALRFDVVTGETARSAWTPSVGLNVQPLARLPLHLKARASGAFRTPTFNDRYWQPGGNPDLRPEHGWTVDGGWALALRDTRRSLAVEATLYQSRLRDQIVWHQDGSVWTPTNLRRTQTVGAEGSVDATVRVARTALRGGGLYTFTVAHDRTDPASRSYDQQLPYIPRHQAKAWVGVSSLGFDFDLHARYVGERFVRADETLPLPGVFLLDAQMQGTRTFHGAALTLVVAVENLTDRSYELMRSYPMPPRHARLTLRLAL